MIISLASRINFQIHCFTTDFFLDIGRFSYFENSSKKTEFLIIELKKQRSNTTQLIAQRYAFDS